MNVRIYQLEGPFGINVQINQEKTKLIADIEGEILDLNDRDVITFSDRLLKRCVITLEDYEYDIAIYVYKRPALIRGVISAIVVPIDTPVTLINE